MAVLRMPPMREARPGFAPWAAGTGSRFAWALLVFGAAATELQPVSCAMGHLPVMGLFFAQLQRGEDRPGVLPCELRRPRPLLGCGFSPFGAADAPSRCVQAGG